MISVEWRTYNDNRTRRHGCDFADENDTYYGLNYKEYADWYFENLAGIVWINGKVYKRDEGVQP
jgi:hypothetical protein